MNQGSTMKKASQYFTPEELQKINAAVTAAEAQTAGEIVPVLATESHGYERAEDIAGLCFALSVVGLVWQYAPKLKPVSEWNPTVMVPAIEYWHVVFILVPLFIVGAWLAARIPLMRRLFLNVSQMQQRVEEAAQRVFYQQKLTSTRDATGILIYVSLFEQTVRVMGDDAISGKLDDTTWQEVRDLILSGFKNNQGCDGFCAGIKRCGEILSEHFPIKPDDSNELPNQLVIID